MEPTGRRRWWATLATASMVASGMAALPAMAAPAAPEASGPGDIDSEVTAQLEAEGRTDVWVRFAERPDMTQFSSIADWDARGQAVVDALKAAAEGSQDALRDSLDEDGVEYQAFWATNSIRVSAADADLVTSMSRASGVEGIYPTMEIEIPEPDPEATLPAPAATEWGIDDINAPEVWAEGIDGSDIVVASIDTGAQYDHPALVNQYRGNNGDGTFTHDYNWFDAAGTSPNFPADGNGHGTHVTGTMVGSDGGDNQVGVAPGAKWIAANGCCPTDAALVASGEWMLEPTDLDGENPDVSKRPHIINNSWGTTLPSNDPFMEDIIEAWAAGGQFGVFANGNSGPSCNTSGSPGSRTIAYSVGNYNSGHTISTSSSRGAGQDGTIKPNISAPGSQVRSSVPGNGYAVYSGTSMASPHVAGAVALLWSGSPALSGDVEATRALLNGTAIDTNDLQCGGTAENNNVFGEGRLDARAMMDQAPRDGVGTLTGVVTDASDDSAIAGAQVQVVGPIERTATTNDEGAYNALLVAGEYDVTISAFGYQSDTQTVTVEEDGTTTANAALEPAAAGTLSGVVTDGSGYGFPLYARVAVDGTPEATFTDPETGEYSLDLPEGSTYTVTVQVQYDGYTTPSREVTVSGDQTEDFAVPVDAATCSAPGYEFHVEGVTESFDGTEIPDGWSVVDHEGSGQVWAFDDPGGRGNLTGGEGGFAIQDSDEHGSGGVQDTSLVAPSVDMSALTNPVVGFKQDYRPLGDNADVEVSLDGGETWTTVLAQTAAARETETVVPLPDAAGESDVQVRFHHYNVDWDWWWQVDDVFIGNRDCVPAGDGGYVVGNVYNGAGEGIVGATVTNLDAEGQSATTIETSADENLDDGFYWLFSDTPGSNQFEASARNHEAQTQDVTVVHGDAVRADFTLGSGLLVVDPTEIESVQLPDEVVEHTLTVTNEGTGDAEVELLETGGSFTPPATDSVTSEPTTLDVPTTFAAFADDESQVGTLDEGFAPNAPWESLPNYPRVVMDNRMVNVDGAYYSLGGTTGTAAFPDVNRYDPDAGAWEAVAPMPEGASAVNTEAVGDQIVVSGGWKASATTTDTYVYDVAGDSWTQVASAPTGVSASGTAVIDGILYVVGGCSTDACTPMSNVAMAYDLAADSWQTLANYPTPSAFNVCGAVDGELYCSGGNPGSGGIASTYVYDAAADEWSAVADAPTPHWAAGAATASNTFVVQGGVQGAGAGVVSNATYAFDGTAWTTLEPASTPVYRGDISCGIGKAGGSTGGFTPVAAAEHLPGWDDCATFTDVEWLDLDPVTFTVAAGASVDVTVTTDSTGLELGTYEAAIRLRSNTPQDIADVPVTMIVVDEAPEPVGVIEVDPTSVHHTVDLGGSETTDVAFTNTGEGGADVSLSEDADWLTLDPAAFAVAAGETVNSAFTTDAEGLEAGDYTTEVAITTDTGQDLAPITVTLTVLESGPDPVVVDRIAGDNRYETAVLLSQDYEPGVAVAFVATGADFPDALGASALAGVLDSPVLLTHQSKLTSVTAAELERLQPQRVVVLGGTNAVSDAVVAQASDAAGVAAERVAGTTRYGTAAQIAGEFDAGGHVYVATGVDYPDALSAAARAGVLESPVLLVKRTSIPSDTAAALTGLAPSQITVLGGEGAVDQTVVEALRDWAPTSRVGGLNRYVTSVRVFADVLSAETVYVASGENWPDALAGSAKAGSDHEPLLITKKAFVPAAIWNALERLDPDRVVVLGGPGAVSEDVVEDLRGLRAE